MKEFPARFNYGAQLIAIGLLLHVPGTACPGGESQAASPAPPANGGAAAIAPPVPYTAEYSLVKTGMAMAEATYTLARTERGWEFRARAKPAKIMALIIDNKIDEYSLLEIDNGLVKPVEYRYEQKNDAKSIKSLQVQYDWQNRTAAINNGSEVRQLAITADTQDPLSVQLALMQQMKTGCRKARYNVIDELELEKRLFECSGSESVSTALGDHEALKVSYRKGKRETVTWLVPKLNYIPVRIQQFKNNDLNSELRITAVNFE
jgi:hypothetical protein